MMFGCAARETGTFWGAVHGLTVCFDRPVPSIDRAIHVGGGLELLTFSHKYVVPSGAFFCCSSCFF